MEREGANAAFLDHLLKRLPTVNPHPENTPDFYMWRYGYEKAKSYTDRITISSIQFQAEMNSFKLREVYS
ncbi:hypothetical protein HYN46_09590 [Aquirhabdus parva]|uniref:Uncharacterized protein n=2 Tax=Aquirhabdus parva TaxID=2283318 RepID=A0A345P710_9GAMM|nr:hypothetical protein HYN46_09590 [Aquirhabdus parva]